MKIVRLDIEGFRGIRKGIVYLDDFSVLIGANNCGKTTVVEALTLLLGRDRLVRSLTEHDFFGSNPQPADRIRIIATVAGFEPNSSEAHPDWFRMGRGVEKWFDPLTGELHPEKQQTTELLSCQIALCARFDHATLEVEAVRYFFDDASQQDPFDDDASVAQLSPQLIRDIGLFLVPASRTWDRMISFGSELFRRTVSYVGGKPAEAVIEERDRLREPASPLEEDDKLKTLIGEVNNDLTRLFGRKTSLKLRLTSTDSEGVLEAVVPHFATIDGLPIPSRRHGSGLISLQTLVLLMRFGNLRKVNQENFVMAVEEPELHVPPSAQRKLLHLMQSMATQTIITTHSPMVAGIPDPHQVTLLINSDGILSAKRLLSKPLSKAATNCQRGLFLADRVTTVSAIMHPALIIPEGKTDASWLRLFARIVDLKEMDNGPENAAFTHEVGVIPTQNSRVVDTYNELNQVHPAITCLVDGDAPGTDYITGLAESAIPCTRVIQWPRGWAIEHVVGWVCDADPSVLTDVELQMNGIPEDPADLPAFLQDGHKTDDVLQGLLADAIASNEQCAARVAGLLSVLAAIATGRKVLDGAASERRHANGATSIWTTIHAVPGI